MARDFRSAVTIVTTDFEAMYAYKRGEYQRVSERTRVTRSCMYVAHYISISQLTLSLYLMTQCQLKLHHSVTSLAQTLHYIKVAQRIHLADETLIQLTLKLIEHKVVTYVNTLL